MDTNDHADFYAACRYYDIAFNFKNIARENDFILECFRQANEREAKSFIELAAGPARNAVDIAARGLRSAALDLSPAMVAYGLSLARDRGTSMDYRCGDMRSFTTAERYDIAVTLMDSLGYILTSEDLLSHLDSVADALETDGIYIIEMDHPRDVFGVGTSTIDEWESCDGDTIVKTSWAPIKDSFDPITQLTRTEAHFEYSSPQGSGTILDTALQRCYGYQELRALVALSGRFAWHSTYGDFDAAVGFGNDKSSWRMMPLLRKIR